MTNRLMRKDHVLRTRIARGLSDDQQAYRLLLPLVSPDYEHLRQLQDTLDSLALESDPLRADDTIAMLRMLSDDIPVADDAPSSPHDALFTACSAVMSSWESPPPLLEHLTPREHDVLQLLVHGRSNQEIANVLMVTVNTVKTHLRSVYSKFGARTRLEAIARARDLGLL